MKRPGEGRADARTCRAARGDLSHCVGEGEDRQLRVGDAAVGAGEQDGDAGNAAVRAAWNMAGAGDSRRKLSTAVSAQPSADAPTAKPPKTSHTGRKPWRVRTRRQRSAKPWTTSRRQHADPERQVAEQVEEAGRSGKPPAAAWKRDGTATRSRRRAA